MGSQPRPRVAVCMATYNGAPFVARQIRSIQAELSADDEIVIVDDASSDETVSILEGFRDPRLRIVVNERNLGHVRSFERAITLSTGDVVLLADQDDLWISGRVDAFINALANAPVAASALRVATIAGEARPDITIEKRPGVRPIMDIIGLGLGRRAYFGCAMGMRAAVKGRLLPFPAFVEAHDHWLAIIGSTSGGIAHIPEPTVVRTLHDANLTPTSRRSPVKIIGTRVRMVWMILVSGWRAIVWRRPKRRASGE